MAAGASDRGVRTEVHLVLGEDSAASIAALAKSLAVDAVVVGTHGRLGFGSVLLGSVASQVANESPAPVLIVFPGRERAHGRALRPPYGSLLGPRALSPVGNDAVPLAYALASEGSTVHLLHVWHPPVSEGASAARDRDARLAEARRALEVLAAAAPPRAGVRAELHLVEDDDAAETIARSAGAVSADLVVLGTHGRQGLQRVLVGTVASRTIRTGVPVLLVPRLSGR
jgi:nucleotide-binding universal stress UspA family protein